MTSILGISAFFHDSAAALVVDGDIRAAAQEERFTRKKHDSRFPTQAIAYCLSEAGLNPRQLDYIAFYEKPLAKFERLLENYFSFAPIGLRNFSRAVPVWMRERLHVRRAIRRGLGTPSNATLVYLDHHESHAASAFFPSPFERAAILTVDGVGEWSTTCCGVGEGNKIRLTHHLQFPHSLGLLYSAFTHYCGFEVNSAEYDLMALAPYGQPKFVDAILKNVLDLRPDGSFWLNMDYFGYCQGRTMTSSKFDRLFGGPPRTGTSPLQQRHKDLAASIQQIIEEAMLRMGVHLHQQTGIKNLVLAGSVALNGAANARLLREGPYEQIWIQPAAGDAGGALGAAEFVWHQLLDKPRSPEGTDQQKGSFLGPRFTCDEIENILIENHAQYQRFGDESQLLEQVAAAIADGKMVGWFQGRMEFGPWALGARSIFGDARSATLRATMDLKIRFHESFLPLAASCLRDHVHEWFKMRPGEDSSYKLLVAPLLDQRRVPLTKTNEENPWSHSDRAQQVSAARGCVPAVTHIDHTARVQTIDERHGRFYRLLSRFHDLTHCPILVNTSFSLFSEPIVCTPKQAYDAFMQSALDVLVLEDFVLCKTKQVLGFRVSTTAEDSAAIDPASPWSDPLTGDPIVMTPTAAVNPVASTHYPVDDGIPRLLVRTQKPGQNQDVTEIVKEFYEATPFPNYDDVDNGRVLAEKARSGQFAKLLNEQIPYDARVVEIGCGTGQLTNYLGMAHRSVLGVDVCLNSLRLAMKFKTENGIAGASFAQMNLLQPALKDGFFDVIISNGVLHHTANPRAAFERISRLAKPGGYLVVGLYNMYSRSVHYARRKLFRWTGQTNRWLDPHFGKVSASGKKTAWFQDQYCNPHESCHTIDEVLHWMSCCNVEFINSIPKPTPGPVLMPNEQLFTRRSPGVAFTRILSQIAAMGNGYREGGFFIMIGRRLPGDVP